MNRAFQAGALVVAVAMRWHGGQKDPRQVVLAVYLPPTTHMFDDGVGQTTDAATYSRAGRIAVPLEKQTSHGDGVVKRRSWTRRWAGGIQFSWSARSSPQCIGPGIFGRSLRARLLWRVMALDAQLVGK